MAAEFGNVPGKTPRKPESPTLWIFAGPNGSGKSTFYNRTDIEEWGGSVWVINPDLLTVRLMESENFDPQRANGVSLDRIMTWLHASIDVHQTIGVETVLSSGKYRDLVLDAKRRGFGVKIIYAVLKSAELQLERIKIRVAEGGHDVPSDKVIARRKRSFHQLAWYMRQADQCFIFDNSSGPPDLSASWNGSSLDVFKPLPMDMLQVLKTEAVSVVHHLR